MNNMHSTVNACAGYGSTHTVVVTRPRSLRGLHPCRGTLCKDRPSTVVGQGATYINDYSLSMVVLAAVLAFCEVIISSMIVKYTNNAHLLQIVYTILVLLSAAAATLTHMLRQDNRAFAAFATAIISITIVHQSFLYDLCRSPAPTIGRYMVCVIVMLLIYAIIALYCLVIYGYSKTIQCSQTQVNGGQIGRMDCIGPYHAATMHNDNFIDNPST